MVCARLDTSPCLTPHWLPGGHSQTIYAIMLAHYHRLRFKRERVETTDGDFVDFDWASSDNRIGATDTPWISDTDWHNLPSSPNTPALILFHGLEGNSLSPYAQSIAHYFHTRGWIVTIAHFRGCSGTPNRLVRAYYSGDSTDIAFMLNHVRARVPHARWHAVGVSLGGNALLKYVGEQQQAVWLAGCAAISAPVDLVASGQRLSHGFVHRRLYAAYFLRSMKHKIGKKAQQFPDVIDAKRVATAHNLQAFDDAYTAPIHGFNNALDYWAQSSSKPWLRNVSIPTLVLNARNDPFLPESALPTPADCSASVLLHQPAQGGHAGFPTGKFPCHLRWLPQRLSSFFNEGT